MKDKRRTGAFVRQAAILASAGIIVRLIGFAYRLPLTALIGDEGNGIYGASYNIYMFFLVVSSAGFPTAISKMVSERVAKQAYFNAHEVFKTCLLLVGGLGLVASVVLALGAGFFAWIINPEDLAAYYSILALSPTVLLVAIMAVFRGYFQGMSTSEPTAVSQLVEGVISAILTVVLAMVFMRVSEGNVALGAAGGTAGKGVGAFFGLLTLVGIYIYLHPAIKKRIWEDNDPNIAPEPRRDIADEALKTAFPIIIGVAIFSMTNLVDTVMVNNILISAGWEIERVREAFGQLTGKYLPLTTLPVTVSTAIAMAAMPSVASSVVDGQMAEANQKINHAMRLSMLISIPAAVGLGTLADQILLLMFPSFPGGGMMLRVGAVSIIFLAMSQIATGMLQGYGYVKVPMYAAMAGASVKIVLNMILLRIPSINVLGAVISTTVCYAIAAGVNLYVLMRIMGPDARLDFKSVFVKPLMASVVMALASYSVYYMTYLTFHRVFGLLVTNALGCIAAIGVGVVVYFVYLRIIKGIDESDIELMPMGARINKLIKKVIKQRGA